MMPGSGASVPSASAGSMSVPRSIARICMTVRASGILKMTKRRNGMSSGMLLVKM